MNGKEKRKKTRDNALGDVALREKGKEGGREGG